MRRTEAQAIIMTQTQKAFADYDSVHGGIVRGMTRAQMHAYANKRTEYANNVLMRDAPQDIRMSAV